MDVGRRRSAEPPQKNLLDLRSKCQIAGSGDRSSAGCRVNLECSRDISPCWDLDTLSERLVWFYPS